jgi:hypothetical protein
LDRENIYSFEDLDVYKLAREFSREISQLIKKLPNVEDYNLKNQMRRAPKRKNLRITQLPIDLMTYLLNDSMTYN